MRDYIFHMDNIQVLTVTVAEAAKLLGISRNSAYECVIRGEIPALRLGRRLVIPKAALDRMLSEAGRFDPTNQEAP